jgi:hypothetical protein
VHAHQVRRGIPWLQGLYHGTFPKLANDAWPEHVVAAADARYGVVLNVQRGTSMRFEAHVDSNPVSGVLFCSDHPAGGGEVAFSHDPTAAEVRAIDADCSVIRPQAGYPVFFDGRHRAHYARSLMAESDLRVVAVMNYYTESFPESTRPRELNRHLYGLRRSRLIRVPSPHRGPPQRSRSGGTACEGRGAGDRGAAQNRVACVEDGRLAGGHRAGRL